MSSNERALLDFLLSGPLGREELRTQAETAQVISHCDCGCRSIILQTDEATSTAHFADDELPYGRADAIPITAWGVSDSGTEIEVTLHVIFGRMHELEIWDGWDSGKSKGEFPDPETLQWRS
jgi:hypothetical protein